MKKLLITLYFAGIFCAYLSCKHFVLTENIRKHKGVVWSTADRALVLTISLFSWITVAAVGFVEIGDQIKQDQPANW